MALTQKTAVRALGILVLAFSLAFISVPLIIGGHPGEMAAPAATGSYPN